MKYNHIISITFFVAVGFYSQIALGQKALKREVEERIKLEEMPDKAVELLAVWLEESKRKAHRRLALPSASRGPWRPTTRASYFSLWRGLHRVCAEQRRLQIGPRAGFISQHGGRRHPRIITGYWLPIIPAWLLLTRF